MIRLLDYPNCNDRDLMSFIMNEDSVGGARSGETIEQHSLTIYDLPDNFEAGKAFWVEDSPLRWQ